MLVKSNDEEYSIRFFGKWRSTITSPRINYFYIKQVLLVIALVRSKHVKKPLIPQYNKYDPYMRACEASGALQMIKDFDRMAESLNQLRGLDFGVTEGWTIKDAAKPRYKGCEPMKQGPEPVICD